MNSRSHIKTKNSAIFVKIVLKINILQIKIIVKAKDHCHFRREYRGAAHSIRNLKYSLPKEIPIIFTMDLIMIIILSYKS